jgi:hypothetical protein
LFPVSEQAGGLDRCTFEMMQKDLAHARAAWIKEAEEGPEEHERREKSAFLSYCDREGCYADFPATRHTFITNLGRAGVSPKTAQKIARHSDIRLTMNVYSHTDLAEKEEAVKRLPAVWRRPSRLGSDEPKSALPETATESWECYGSAPASQPDENGHSLSAVGAPNQDGDDCESSPQCEAGTVVDASCRSSSPTVASTPGGIRTPNPRFRRPMRYPVAPRALAAAGRAAYGQVERCSSRPTWALGERNPSIRRPATVFRGGYDNSASGARRKVDPGSQPML